MEKDNIKKGIFNLNKISKTKLIVNPTIQTLIRACKKYVPEYKNFRHHNNSINSILASYNYILIVNPGTKTPYRIEIKNRGLGCKSRKIIGIGEGKSVEEAGMMALLGANNIKILFSDNKQITYGIMQ